MSALVDEFANGALDFNGITNLPGFIPRRETVLQVASLQQFQPSGKRKGRKRPKVRRFPVNSTDVYVIGNNQNLFGQEPLLSG